MGLQERSPKFNILFSLNRNATTEPGLKLSNSMRTSGLSAGLDNLKIVLETINQNFNLRINFN